MSRKRFLAVPAAMMIALGTVGVGFQGVAQALPTAPTNVVATAGAAAASVSWTAATTTAPEIVNLYTVTANPGGATCTTTTVAPATTPATTCVVVGLTPGVSYTFTVQATSINGANPGQGPASTASNAVVPTDPPAPTGLTVSNASPTSSDQARLTWSASAGPANVSTIAGYRIDVTNGANPPVTHSIFTNSLTRDFTITGAASQLPAGFWVVGQAYRFRVVTVLNGTVTPTTATGPNNGSATGTLSQESDLTANFVPWTVPSWAVDPVFTVATGNASATVGWTAVNGAVAAGTGGYPIAGYTLTATPTSGSAVSCTTTLLTCTLAGLTPGMQYGLTLVAQNTAPNRNTSILEVGPTLTVPASPLAPAPPTNVTATAGFQQATVSWTAPSNPGATGILRYRAYAYPAATAPTIDPTTAQPPIAPAAGAPTSTCTVTGTPPVTTCTMIGLTNGTDYRIYVQAMNADPTTAAFANEVSPLSAPSAIVTPGNPSVPGVPGAPVAVAGVGQVTLTWTAPSSQGSSAITGYTVTGTPGGTCTTSALTCTITGLTAGTSYTFTVRATNAVGQGAASGASNAVTPTAAVPGAPTNVSAVAGDAKATVAWTAPSNNGGSAITGYTVTSSANLVGAPVRTCTTTGTTTCEVTGLTNDVTYTFTVVARNSVGTGAASAASNAVTPKAVTPPPVTKTITIVGTRGTGSEANMIFVDGITTNLVGKTMTPYFRFPGQSGFTAGTGTRTVDANGDFAWQRKTGKRIVVEFRGDGVTSNRIVIQAK